MLKLNFHHLYYFYRIAGTGQIARAARILRIGQPALSTQLKQFEEHLGYRLFDRRRGQALTLTRPGEILYRYSQEIFRLSDEMLAAARGQKSADGLSLRLGALDWLPKQEVSDLIDRTVRRFDCFVSVFEDSAAVLMRKLADQQLDLILTNFSVSHSDQWPFRSRRIAALPVRIYGAPVFAPLREGFPNSLAGQPMILPTRQGRTRQQIEDFLQNLGIQVKTVGEVQDGELLRRAALSGQALVALAESTVRAEVERGDLLEIGELESVKEEVWMVASRRLLPHPVVAYLMNGSRAGASAARTVARPKVAPAKGSRSMAHHAIKTRFEESANSDRTKK